MSWSEIAYLLKPIHINEIIFAKRRSFRQTISKRILANREDYHLSRTMLFPIMHGGPYKFSRQITSWFYLVRPTIPILTRKNMLLKVELCANFITKVGL